MVDEYKDAEFWTKKFLDRCDAEQKSAERDYRQMKLVELLGWCIGSVVFMILIGFVCFVEQ